MMPVSGMLVFTWDNLKGSSDHRPFPPLAKFHVSQVPAVKMKADRLSMQAIDDRVVRGAERAQHVEIQLTQLVRFGDRALRQFGKNTEDCFHKQMIRCNKRGEIAT